MAKERERVRPCSACRTEEVTSRFLYILGRRQGEHDNICQSRTEQHFKKKRSVLLFVKNTLARFGFRTRMMRTEEECFSKVKTTKED